MKKYPNKCVACGSPCGYTGLLNSADCSNASCKNAEVTTIPPGGGYVFVDASKPFSISLGSVVKATTPPPVQITSIVPQMALKRKQYESKASEFEFAEWLLGDVSLDRKYSPCLYVGSWDSNAEGRPPQIGDSLIKGITNYSRGVTGWKDGSYPAFHFENAQDICMWNHERTDLNITHLLLAHGSASVRVKCVQRVPSHIPIMVAPFSSVTIPVGYLSFSL